MLADGNELRGLLAFLGRDKLIVEAQAIEPVLGTYAANIQAWEIADQRSLTRTRNGLLIVGALLLLGSDSLGPTYLLVTAGLFVVPLLFPVPASVHNNNAEHVRTIALNLLKWSTEKAEECRDFCINQRPDLALLYVLLTSTDAK